MFRRHVQRVEAVPLVLHLGALDDCEPHTGEDVFELSPDDGQGMAMTESDRAARERDVDGARGRRECRSLLEPLRPARLELFLQSVRELTELLLFCGSGCREPLHPFREDAVFSAEIAIAY